MKVVVTQSVLINALKRGGVAAVSPEGQAEEFRTKIPTRRCVRILADKKAISIESTTEGVASKSEMPVSDQVAVEQEGGACVPAKELTSLCSKLFPDHKVSIELIPSGKPKVNDTVAVKALDGSECQVQAEFEAFPVEDFEAAKYADEPVAIKTKVEAVKKHCGAIEFASNPADYQNLHNNLAIEESDGVVYFVGTNGKRVAVVDVKKDDFGSGSLNGELLLIDAVTCGSILGTLPPDAELLMVREPDGQHIVLKCLDSWFRVAMVDEVRKAKFPKYKKAMTTPVKVEVVLNRKDLDLALAVVMEANKGRGKYEVKTGKDHVVVRGKGVTALKEVQAKVKCDSVVSEGLQDGVIHLNSTFFSEAIKKMKGDKIKLSFTPDEKKAKVASVDSPEFTYVMLRLVEDEAN